MIVVANICFTLLAVAAALCLIRLIRPGSTANRVVALDMLVVVIVAALLVQAVVLDSDIYLDGALVVSLLGFVATISVARFVERRNS